MTRRSDMDSGENKGPGAGTETAEKKKKPFLYSAFYDSSDVEQAAREAYDDSMTEEELRKKRKRDWLFLLIGIPALIGIMYFIVLISGR